MTDYYYDIGSYHPQSEARTLYSSSIDDTAYYHNHTNSRTATSSSLRSTTRRGAAAAAAAVESGKPSSRKLPNSNATKSSSSKRQSRSNSNSTNRRRTTATTTKTTSRDQQQQYQHQHRMSYMDNSSRPTTTHSHPTARDHRQEHTMDPRTYSDRRNDELFLTWRLDPEESLSDWTIIVRSIGTADGSNNNNKDNRDDDNASNEDTFSQYSTDYNNNNDSNNNNTSYNVRYYYVHKAQLGVGPRRSEYFARLFRSKRTTTNTAGSHHKTSFDYHITNHTNISDEAESRIELKPSAAAAFPLMLDYIYSPPGVPVKVSTESAVALRHLATCFGIRDLFSEVTTFIHNDLTVDTSLTYIREAGIYNHEKLLSAAVKLCATKFESVKISQLVTLEPRVFQKIVTSPNCNCDSQVLSSRVSTYLRCRPGSYNWNFLKSITSPSKMPRVATEDSLFLISVLAQLGAIPKGLSTNRSRSMSVASQHDNDDEDDDDDQEAVDSEEEEEEEETGPTLYERCAVSAVEAVRRAVNGVVMPTSSSKSSNKRNQNNNNAAIRSISVDYQSLPANIKVDLLERSLLQQPPSETKSSSSSNNKVNSAMKGDADIAAGEDVKQLKRTYVKKIDKYKQMLEKKKEEIRVYEEELSKFQRVPVTHRIPPLLTQYTFKENPEYDRYGQSVYGDDPPTALPRIGEYDMDGWILKEDQWAENGVLNTRNWPMFYYKAN